MGEINRSPLVRELPSIGYGIHSRARPQSDRERVAVAARVGAGHERAGLPVADDSLAAAHDPGPVVDGVDLVAAPGKRRARLGGDTRLGVDQAVTVDARAWRFDRFRGAQAE